MPRILLSLFVAASLWFMMFSPWTAPHINFWLAMSASAVILTLLALLFGGLRLPRMSVREWGLSLVLGVVIAALLWCAFWVGDKVSQWLFDFARPQVDLIYGMKTGKAPWVLSLLLLLVIGPAEEIFWRGYIQQSLVNKLRRRYRRCALAVANRKAKNWAFIITTAVHAHYGGAGLRYSLGRPLSADAQAAASHRHQPRVVGCGGICVVTSVNSGTSGRNLYVPFSLSRWQTMCWSPLLTMSHSTRITVL